jgi:anhydro-N-acetylmuramic acid kinase
MRVLGIMSGTSIDGVDYALCEVQKHSIRLLRLWSRAFPKPLQRRLHAAAANECTAHELAQLHHDLGRLYAKQAQQLNARAELIGLHGQTVFHNPDRRAPATLQIGEPAYLAESLRVPVVSNFRPADLAAGGQGAPLATLFHQVVFAHRGRHVCVNNLGGISNVTSLDWRSGHTPRITAFDTGPASVLLDLAMRELTHGKKTCDRGGAWAKGGEISEPLLRCWLKHPFFKAAPPKSTGRELFGETFWRAEQKRIAAARLSPFDTLATLTEFAARSLALNYRLHLPTTPDTVVLSGGGAKNPMLVQRIRANLLLLNPSTRVVTAEDFGWPSSAIEPAAFALLAYYRWKDWPANLPTTTGARRAALLGQISGDS